MSLRDPFPAGTLAVVATPLGNPDDISRRALTVLSRADLIAAEDTRTARRMLAGHHIEKPLLSYHDWNEAARAKTLIARLREGARVALVSEAGTPSISDPGYDLVRAAREAGIPVFPVPGPSALITFLSASGLPTNAFTFHGFPPPRSSKRRALFAALADRAETQVFYESPHRIAQALADGLAAFGDREAALGREMTKPYEEFFFGRLSEIAARIGERERVRGEVCWGVRGAEGERRPEGSAAESLETALDSAAAGSEPLKEAARVIAAGHGLPVKEVYARLTALRRERSP